MEETTRQRYKTLTKSTAGKLLEIIKTIEKKILKAMEEEGYPRLSLQAALQASRIIVFTENMAERNDYMRTLMPSDAKETADIPLSRMKKPDVRFNELFEKELERIVPLFKNRDTEALLAMQRDFPLEEVLEAYRGESLFRSLAAQGKAVAARFEHDVLKEAYKQLKSLASEEKAKYGDAFLSLWKGKKDTGEPLPYQEGRKLAAFLRQYDVSEEGARELFRETTAYQGRDKAAYVQRLVTEAIKEQVIYRRILALPSDPRDLEGMKDIYPACLKDTLNHKGKKALLSFGEEQKIAKALTGAGYAESELNAALALSPAMFTPGLNPKEAKADLLEGKGGGLPLVTGEYARTEDVYKRILSECADELVAKRAPFTVDDRREAYNIYATRKLLKEYGATEEEVEDILETYGGIPEQERTKEYLKGLLEKAKEVQEESLTEDPREETAARLMQEKKKEEAARASWAPVRRRGETEPAKEAEAAEEVQEARPEKTREEKFRSRRALRQMRDRVRSFSFATKKEEGMGADELYDKCAEEIKGKTGTSHSDQVDEQLILYMFNQGYREEEIENVLDKKSPVAQRTRQTDYGKNRIKNIKSKHPEVREAISRQARNYLQTKERQGKTMTEYDRAMVRVKDPVGVPQ